MITSKEQDGAFDYAASMGLESVLQDCINELLPQKPGDIYTFLSDYFAERRPESYIIKKVEHDVEFSGDGTLCSRLDLWVATRCAPAKVASSTFIPIRALPRKEGEEENDEEDTKQRQQVAFEHELKTVVEGILQKDLFEISLLEAVEEIEDEDIKAAISRLVFFARGSVKGTSPSFSLRSTAQKKNGLVPRIDKKLDPLPPAAFVLYRRGGEGSGVQQVCVHFVSSPGGKASVKSMARVVAKWKGDGSGTTRELEAGGDGLTKALSEITVAVESAGYTAGVDVQAVPTIAYKRRAVNSGEEADSDGILAQVKSMCDILKESPLVKLVAVKGYEVKSESEVGQEVKEVESGEEEKREELPDLSAHDWKEVCRALGGDMTICCDNLEAAKDGSVLCHEEVDEAEKKKAELEAAIPADGEDEATETEAVTIPAFASTALYCELNGEMPQRDIDIIAQLDMTRASISNCPLFISATPAAFYRGCESAVFSALAANPSLVALPVPHGENAGAANTFASLE